MAEFSFNPITNRLDLTGSSSGASPIESISTDDDSVATPVDGVIKIIGNLSFINKTNEIFTQAAGEFVFLNLTNRFKASILTVGAQTSNVGSFDADTIATGYIAQSMVVGTHVDTGDSTVFFFNIGVKTDGLATSFIGGVAPTATTNYFDASMAAATVVIQCQGNSFAIVVTGIAGKNIIWNTTSYYIPAF